ncbi:transmembrane protein 265-like isoform X2 [Corythoichthys intestinalis]|nr:transmembrane protein 265-like isoform X2 [Corythoichthys intestinalis]
MSHSSDISIKVDEETPLNTMPGSADSQTTYTAKKNGCVTTACCQDKHHRKLAVCSIICGISCIGIKALINSVKAEKEVNRELSARFSRRSKRLAITSIVIWLTILALTPILMALISYLVTLKD